MNVAVGLVFNKERKILINRRPEGKTFAGYWEFPGGKIEAGETAVEALIREFFEETGLQLLKPTHFMALSYQMQEKEIHLHVFQCFEYQGEPQCLEGQAEMCWVSVAEINDYQFPEANQAIIERLLQIKLSNNESLTR